ncbi:MAG: DapH/DapD/GlmU-related protein [Planctomycetota bacterium]|nr:DapH/DapD/GlmU-related protein [Planctomycetota bacterium]
MVQAKVLVLGYGVEMRRVLALLQDSSMELVGVIPWSGSDRPIQWDEESGIQRHQIIGSFDQIASVIEREATAVCFAFSRPTERWEALRWCQKLAAEVVGTISPAARLGAQVRLAAGVVIDQGCSVEIGASVGSASLLMPGARLGIGARCGDACVLEAGSSLDDYSRIGDQVFLGAGSRVLAGRFVGQGAVVLPGSVITSDVGPGTIVSGIPAVVVESSVLSEED